MFDHRIYATTIDVLCSNSMFQSGIKHLCDSAGMSRILSN